MKSIRILLITLIAFFIASCKKDNETAVFAIPEVKSLAEIRSRVAVTAAKETNADGKIYVTAKWLFYIAQESGIHVFDNQNPASPQNIAFIQLEGVHDIAVKGDYLYADNYVDLMVFDISDIQHIQLAKNVMNTISFYPTYPANVEYFDNSVYPNQDEIVVGYRFELRKRPKERNWGPTMAMEDMSAAPSTGTGGSFARFQINKNALYTTESFNLNVFNISNPVQTFFDKKVYMETWFGGGQFETLFKQGDYLFIGSTNGMYVVDATNEFSPHFISSFSHATSCDPVVVDGTIAYITLRGGTTCNASIPDQINVIDITDILHPVLTSAYLLNQPLGLGVRNNAIYVCSGNGGGLNVFDASNPNALKLRNTYQDEVTDVIALNSHLIAVGKNKIIQYNYGEDFSLVPISIVNF